MDVTRGFSFCAFLDKHDLSDFTYKFINQEQMEAVYKGVQNERNNMRERQIWKNFCEDRKQDVEDIYDDEEIHPGPDCQQYMLDKIESILMSTLTQVNLLTEEEEVGTSDESPFPPQFQTPADGCLKIIELEENSDDETKKKSLQPSNISSGEERFEQGEIRQDNKKLMAFGDISQDLINESLKIVTNLSPCHSSENVAMKKKKKRTVFSEKNYLGNSTRLEKIKVAWSKLYDILKEILNYLEMHSSQTLEHSHMLVLEKRAQEFCNRFVRLHEYHLKIQMSDFKRSLNLSIYFAQHLHLQMLIKKMISLLHNIYKAFEMFHSLLPDVWDSYQVKLHLYRLVQMIVDFSGSCSAVPLLQSIHSNLNEIPNVLQVANCILEITKDYNVSVQTTNTEIAASCIPGPKHGGRIRSASSVKSNKNHGKVSSRLSMYSLFSNKNSGSSSTKLPIRTTRLDTKNKFMNSKFNREEDCQIDSAAMPLQQQATGSQKDGRPLMNGRQARRKFIRRKPLPEDDIQTVVQMMQSSPESTSRRFNYQEVSDEVLTLRRMLDKKKDPAGERELPHRLSSSCAGERAVGGAGDAGLRPRPPATPNAPHPIGLRKPQNILLVNIISETPESEADKNDCASDKMPELLRVDKSKENTRKDPTMKIYVNKNSEEKIFQYHSSFRQAMNKRQVPWSMVEQLSDDILDESILIIAKDMLLDKVLKKLYKMELI